MNPAAAVTADVIATRHRWCYDNSKPSLSLIHRSILGVAVHSVPNYALQHIKTATFQPLLPLRHREDLFHFPEFSYYNSTQKRKELLLIQAEKSRLESDSEYLR